MTVEQYLIRDPDQVRVELVEELPPACGGAVTFPHGDVVWMLVEPPPVDVVAPDPDELAAWSEVAYAAFEAGEPVTAADQAARFEIPVEVAHAAYWQGVWEWLERQAPAWTV